MPTIGPLLSMGVVIPLQSAKKAIDGKPTHFWAQELQQGKGFVPTQNVFYAKAAMDHLVWQRVMEMVSPGYLKSIRQRTQREFNQQWWWQPGETVPERAPDLEQAVER